MVHPNLGHLKDSQIEKVDLAYYDIFVQTYCMNYFVLTMHGQFFKPAKDGVPAKMPWCVLHPVGDPHNWFVLLAHEL